VREELLGTESCLVHFFAGLDGRWGNDTPFVLSCSLDDIERVVADRTVGGASPDYWWAPDHSWYVYTDYDSTLTWVGGSRDLIDATASDAEVESFVGVPRRRTEAEG
jgi:hypothetical protein